MARSSSGQRVGALAAVLLLLASLLRWSPAAAGEADPEVGGIVYDAPPECPPRSALIEAIEARKTPRPEVDHRTFRVAIERSHDGVFEGRLEVVGTAHVPRLTRGADCAAVVRTLAVFVVIARAPEGEGPLGQPETPSTPPPHDPPLPVAQPAPPPTGPHTPPAVAPPPSGSTHLRFGASVRPSLLVPSSSSAHSTAATGVRVQNEVAWLPASRFPIAPLGRFSFGTAAFDAGLSPGTASFRFRTARLEACADIDLGHSFELEPCAGAELGDLVATTSSLPIAVRASTRWEAATVGGGLRWAVLPWISLGADLVAVLPFTRKRFGFVDPVQVVYSVPATFIDLGAVLGVVARFD